ncbi:hypothetical protein FRC10_004719 [Ceratobasidium sp. 414]|nr:hypothetical protein FRC10_004719 [Ceratobasidium sp. 414]
MSKTLAFLVPSCLTASVVTSFVIFNLTWSKRIQLPISDADILPDFVEGALHDPFDIAKPEEVVDGTPLDEDKFWMKVRKRKIIQTWILSFGLVLACGELGRYMRAEYVEDKPGIFSHAVEVVLLAYLVFLSGVSVSVTDVPVHWSHVVHSSTLSALGFSLYLIVQVLPSGPRLETSYISLIGTESLPHSLVIASLGIATFIGVTIPRAPKLHFPPEFVYQLNTLGVSAPKGPDNVIQESHVSIASFLLFNYVTPVAMLGYYAESLDISDLPILTAGLRSPLVFSQMRKVLRDVRLPAWLHVKPGSSNPVVANQLWSVSVIKLQIPLKIQLNTMLFAKTLVRKDVVSAGSSQTRGATPTEGNADQPPHKENDTPEEFSSKAQVHTLMTTDVDRVSQFHIYFYPLIDAPIELAIGTFFLYTLLVLIPVNHYGSKFAVVAQDNLMNSRDERIALMNEILGAIRMLKFMAWERNFENRALGLRTKELKYQKQSYLIQARQKILFNAFWDSTPDPLLNSLMTLASFFHFAVVRQQSLTPSIAFTVLAVFNELRYAMNTLPETIINLLQSVVSAKRIEKYMASAEVSDIQSIKETALDPTIKFVSASVSWPQQRPSSSSVSSTLFTPRTRFTISDLSAEFPEGKLSLVCGKIGSGKSLLLLALLGEADVLAGQVIAPRSPPDTLAHLNTQMDLNDSNWIIQGVCAYVPQTAWLQNDSIQNNILFGLPMNRERYQKTLEVCALSADLAMIEDGDQAEIGTLGISKGTTFLELRIITGERGVNLSGGQKARVSLARAIYSRASVLFLDDVLSAVDAHTASHLFELCLRGPLSHDRSIVLVSHHVQLILPGASYVVSFSTQLIGEAIDDPIQVALDNGRVLFSGSQAQFMDSPAMQNITYTPKTGDTNKDKLKLGRHGEDDQKHGEAELLDPIVDTTVSLPSGQGLQAASIQRAPRKLIEDEVRAVGRVKGKIWTTYLNACGSYVSTPTAETFNPINSSLGVLDDIFHCDAWRCLGSCLNKWMATDPDTRGPIWFITIYALISFSGMLLQSLRWYVLYDGSIRASTVLYKRIVECS